LVKQRYEEKNMLKKNHAFIIVLPYNHSNDNIDSCWWNTEVHSVVKAPCFSSFASIELEANKHISWHNHCWSNLFSTPHNW